MKYFQVVYMKQCQFCTLTTRNEKTDKRQSKSAHTGSVMYDFEIPLTNNRLIPPQ